jgi:hypothetical protein
MVPAARARDTGMRSDRPRYRAFCRIMSEAFAAIMMIAALVLPDAVGCSNCKRPFGTD